MEELKRLISSRHGYRTHLKKLVAKATELSEQYSNDMTTQLDPTTLIDLRDQLRHKSDILIDLDQKISVLIGSEEDLEREVIEAEEHCSLIFTNVAWVTRLLEVCTAVESSTVQTPPNMLLTTHILVLAPSSRAG